MTDYYKNFALYYQELAEKRNHFGVQSEVLHKLFKEQNIDYNNRILDAACGTGAVGILLFEAGYKNIHLTDGSANMIDFAKNRIDYNIPITQFKWEDLNIYIDKVGKFDVIFIFGNSYAHASPTSHKQILENIYTGLNSGGCFIFDIREWTKDISGKSIQPNKPDYSFIQLGEISIRGRALSIDNIINYNHNKQKQIVSYVIKDIKAKQVIETIHLEYSIFSVDDILPVLKSVGFNLENIKTRKLDNWSYQAICCKK